jgi:hypothetical protein
MALLLSKLSDRDQLQYLDEGLSCSMILVTIASIADVTTVGSFDSLTLRG